MKTSWYRNGEKPVRVGPYQRQFEGGADRYSWWNGRFFGLCATTPAAASTFAYRMTKSLRQNLPWRGVYKVRGQE